MKKKHPIEALIEQGEHQQLDFKFEVSDSKKIARTLSAFANTDGGRLLIGVKDNGAISGVRSEEEYYMTKEIGWLSQKKDWKGLKSIGMEEKTIRKDGQEKKEIRYYISSLNEDIELFSRAVRGHWSVESMHWQLDVTFKEDANRTLDKQAAENLNIIRKWCLSILKMVEIFRPNLSMKKKRFVISMNPAEFLEQVLNF